MMSALTAGFLGWPCFQEVTAVEKTADGYALTQAITGGTRTISVTGPVVVAATSDAVPVKVPSMKEILAAGKKPVEVVSVEDVAPVEIGVTVTGRSKPAPKARKNQVFTGESAVADLVAALRTNGIL